MAKCKGALRVEGKKEIKDILKRLTENDGLLVEFKSGKNGSDIDLSLFTANRKAGKLTKGDEIDIENKKSGHSKDPACNNSHITDKEFRHIEIHRNTYKFHLGFNYRIEFIDFFDRFNDDYFYIIGAPYADDTSGDTVHYFTIRFVSQAFYDAMRQYENKNPLKIDMIDSKEKIINILGNDELAEIKPCPPHWE